mmetsp:Transcript_62218/g.136238  ORF Transcript_62218/g.136238 Transcript_62218/m.136238 type:complete len:137 (-) Transcript_62218:67-477(-)
MGCKGSKDVAPRAETRAEPEDRKETTHTTPMEEVEPSTVPVTEEVKELPVDTEPEMRVESESFLEEKEPHPIEPMEPPSSACEVLTVDATKRGRGHSGEDEETVTTALPREDESPRNTDDKVEGAREVPLCGFCSW